MNVYFNNTFRGHFPIGTAAVVVAESQQDAANALSIELEKEGLKQTIDPNNMIYISFTFPSVYVLLDGDY